MPWRVPELHNRMLSRPGDNACCYLPGGETAGCCPAAPVVTRETTVALSQCSAAAASTTFRLACAGGERLKAAPASEFYLSPPTTVRIPRTTSMVGRAVHWRDAPTSHQQSIPSRALLLVGHWSAVFQPYGQTHTVDVEQRMPNTAFSCWSDWPPAPTYSPCLHLPRSLQPQACVASFERLERPCSQPVKVHHTSKSILPCRYIPDPLHSCRHSSVLFSPPVKLALDSSLACTNHVLHLYELDHFPGGSYLFQSLSIVPHCRRSSAFSSRWPCSRANLSPPTEGCAS